MAIARWTAAGAVGCIAIGWAFAQSPYLLPGELTLDQAAAPDATLTALLISVGVGVLVLVPSLLYLYRLVLRGTLVQVLTPDQPPVTYGKVTPEVARRILCQHIGRGLIVQE